MRRFPSLDGLRAVSISLVLLNHLTGTKYFLSSAILRPLGDIGNFGVRIFFVISGFLITSLLLSELNKTDAISLKKFYIRRTLRIFPASYIYIASLILAWRAGWLSLRSPDILHAATYSMNYHLTDVWATRHLWSLSVEEQFYLMWPSILVFAKPRYATWVLSVALIAVPIGRVGLYVFQPSYRPYIGLSFETVCDALATGCLLSLLGPVLSRSRAYKAVIAHRTFAILIIVALFVNKLGSDHPIAYFLVGVPVVNIIIAMSVDRYLRFPELPVGRFLNTRPMEAIGVLSYSLYLWQQPFLIQSRTPASSLTVFPFNIITAVGLALISHRLIEMPFLRLKRRFESA